jgi:hypothetical protein
LKKFTAAWLKYADSGLKSLKSENIVDVDVFIKTFMRGEEGEAWSKASVLVLQCLEELNDGSHGFNAIETS